MIERLTVGKLKELLKKYNVPDDALITAESDEEGNRNTVCYDVNIDRVGRKESTCYKGKWYEFVSGDDVIGFDMEQDKDKVFVTFKVLY